MAGAVDDSTINIVVVIIIIIIIIIGPLPQFCRTPERLIIVDGLAQWSGCPSLASGLFLPCAKSMIDR